VKRLLLTLFVLGILLPASAMEVRYVRALPTELGPGNILHTFLSEVTIEFVAKDTLAVAYGGGVGLIDVTDGSVEMLPVEREVGRRTARFVLDQEIKDEQLGIITFLEGPADNSPWPRYVYNLFADRLCHLNTATTAERRDCFGEFRHYFEIDNRRGERSIARNFELYRVDTASGDRTLLDDYSMEELFGRDFFSRQATLVDSIGDELLLLLIGSAPDGVPHVVSLAENGVVVDVRRVEGSDSVRNAAFVGANHMAVLVDGEIVGDESVYEVAIVDFDGNRVAELDELRVFDMRQYLAVSADGRWLAVFGYNVDLGQQGLFLYEIVRE
jgi:hypothetical protein